MINYTTIYLKARQMAEKVALWAFYNPLWIEAAILCLFALIGCSPVKYIPIETQTRVEYRDTTVYKLDTVYLPKEKIVYAVPQLDTLVLETSVAISTSYLDTSKLMLTGEMRNKPTIEMPVPVRTITRDSIVTKEVPVEVEVVKTQTPKWAWICLGLNVLVLLILALKLYIKLKP